MLSKYFKMKIETAEFVEHLQDLFRELKEKKVLLYGAGAGFVALNKIYKFSSKLNIVAIADMKFYENPVETFLDIKAIAPDSILNEDFDVILITNETTRGIFNYLTAELSIAEDKIKTIFLETIRSENSNYNYLCYMNFEKTLPKLVKRLKNRRVMLYGAGAFLELINKYFDISGLNIIGVADRRFEKHDENECFLGYKVYSVDEIAEANPDYVLVSTINCVRIIEHLYYDVLNQTGIKIKPLVRKRFWPLVKEIFG